jgi:hypothetical protein
MADAAASQRAQPAKEPVTASAKPAEAISRQQTTSEQSQEATADLHPPPFEDFLAEPAATVPPVPPCPKCQAVCVVRLPRGPAGAIGQWRCNRCAHQWYDNDLERDYRVAAAQARMGMRPEDWEVRESGKWMLTTKDGSFGDTGLEGSPQLPPHLYPNAMQQPVTAEDLERVVAAAIQTAREQLIESLPSSVQAVSSPVQPTVQPTPTFDLSKKDSINQARILKILRKANKAGTHTGDKIAWQGPLWKLADLVVGLHGDGKIVASSETNALHQACQCFVRKDGNPLTPGSLRETRRHRQAKDEGNV